MYFARAKFVFLDNGYYPPSIGSDCGLVNATMSFDGPTIGDLLADASVPWSFYADGYGAMATENSYGQFRGDTGTSSSAGSLAPCSGV